MTFDRSKFMYSSDLLGLGSTSTNDFAAPVIPTQSLAPGTYKTSRATIALANSSQITTLQANIAGAESVWRYVSGMAIVDFPNTFAIQYQVEILAFYSGGTLIVDTYVINQTGGSITIPTITPTFRASLITAPF